jgi:hypothetical protein
LSASNKMSRIEERLVACSLDSTLGIGGCLDIEGDSCEFGSDLLAILVGLDFDLDCGEV